ncbi:hypothetical protein ACTM96_13540, partial [Mediterraneibacter faecis]|uniref:hypothetical protein n=1 Tax=Mediterraneibacter faecis TaxID=592978 RepID=UPI003F8A5D19
SIIKLKWLIMTGIVAHTYPEWWLKLAGQVAHWSTDYSIYSDHPNIQVSLDVELKDSYLDLSSGDEIVVYYDGSIIDEKAETVYAITLRTPANRETQ